MPDLGNAFSQWLLSQLEMMPLTLLRQGAELRASSRLVDMILGEREAAEVRALLARPLGDQPRAATVLIPGIMGSLLASVRGIGALIWLNPEVIANGHINLLDLDDDGRADRSPDVEIMPVGIEKLTYLKTILTLARETRLYEFPYDWRRHVEYNADLLHGCIQRWAQADPERRFTLVGHSMGGMVARTYLARHPREAEAKIERAILIGSPIYGAPITACIFTGQTQPSRVVGRLHDGNDVVRFASGLPSTYQLLPPPPELWQPARDYPANWDLYDATAWGEAPVRQRFLDDARHLHALLAAADPQVEITQIAGCNQRTPTDIRLPAPDEASDEPIELGLVVQDAGPDAGDELVPLWSTQAPGVATYYVDESHYALPANDHVLAAVLALIHGEPCPLPDAPPQPSGILRSLRATSLMQQVAEIKEHIEAGNLRREDLVKLLFAR